MNKAALQTHCYGHAQKLVINYCIKNTKNFKDMDYVEKNIQSYLKN